MSASRSINLPRLGGNLVAEVTAGGLRPGLPRRIPAEVFRIDRIVYSRQRCPLCERQGMKVQPMTDGYSYRLVLTCRRGCGCQVEA